MISKVVIKLLNSFSGSFINHCGEFIAHKKGLAFFTLTNCETEMDVKCKVLEWLSRDAYKTEPWRSEKKNTEHHEFIRNGINEFLGTDFTHEDMHRIYTKLGNCANHGLTIRFIASGYKMEVLERA